MFIAVDGIDGAGKTTLIAQFAAALRSRRPLVTKEPTNESPWAGQIRDSALKKRRSKNDELALFHHDRLWHIAHVIKPALLDERIVLCDRYVDSTLAFQADDEQEANKLYQTLEKEILIPNLTIILDCPVEIGLARIEKGRDRFTTYETIETLKKARRIYRSRQGPNYVHIDGSQSAETTCVSAFNAVAKQFADISRDLLDHLRRSNLSTVSPRKWASI